MGKRSFAARLQQLFSAHDMTLGAPWKRILEFAIPMLIGNLAQQLYNTADSITEQGYRYVFRCNIKGSQEAG